MSMELNLNFHDPQHFTVSLISDNKREETKLLGFTSPISDKGQEHIRWYLEEYVTQYSADIDSDTAQKIDKQLPVLGKALFNKVFSSKAAHRLFKKFKENKTQGRLLTITAAYPAILSLPWELLYYPARKGHFLIDESPPISIRRRMRGAGDQSFSINPKSQAHILFIVSRPSNADAINPHADAQAILDGLDKCLAERMTVEFLLTPTLSNLQKRLENKALPHVDIVHFNGHCLFDEVGHLGNEARTALNIQSEVLKRDAAAIEIGKNTGYLLFENNNGESHFVPAQLFANMLNRHQVPLLILSAYHGTSVDNHKNRDNLVAQLAAMGIPFVLAMRYSMLIPATRKFFKAFYEALAQGQTIGTAFDMARFVLYQETIRRETSLQVQERVNIHLQDWFLPVLYQQVPDSPLLLSPNGECYLGTLPLHNNLPKQTGEFVGRCNELWHIERQFMRGTRRITINGVEGQGKTCLAQETGHWLQKTGLFKCVVFIDFANLQGVDFVSMAVSLIASVLQKNLLDAESVTQALRRVPTLLIFDNVDFSAEENPHFANGGTAPALQTDTTGAMHLGNSSVFQTGHETTDSLMNFGNSSAFQTGLETTDSLLLNQGRVKEISGTATTNAIFPHTSEQASTSVNTGTANSLLFNKEKLGGISGAPQTAIETTGTEKNSLLFNKERLGGISGAPQTAVETTTSFPFKRVRLGILGASGSETKNSTLFNTEGLGGISGASQTGAKTAAKTATLFNTEGLGGISGTSAASQTATPLDGISSAPQTVTKTTDSSKRQEEITRLLNMAKKWSEAGKSRLIIITHRPQYHAAFSNTGSLKHYQLALDSLNQTEALRYFDALLQSPPGPVYEIPQREAVERLLGQIHYHPLSINLLARQVKNDTIGAVSWRLESLLVAYPVNMSPFEKALMASLNLSVEKLESSQQWLQKIGVFQGGAFENVLQAIMELPEAQGSPLLQSLESMALIQAEKLNGVTVPYFHFHPRLASLLWARMSPTEQQLSTARYHQGYYELSQFLYNEEKNNFHQTNAIARKELPNLLHAVYGALATGKSWAIEFAVSVHVFLHDFGIKSDLDQLVVNKETVEQVGFSQEWLTNRSNQGEQLYAASHYQEAQAVFEEILERLDETPTYQRCVILGWLGRCLAEQGQFELSADYFRQTLTELGQLEYSQQVRQEVGRMQTYLATALKEIKDYSGAREAYQAALSIVREFKDTHSEAAIQSQLATLAMLQGFPDEAEQRFREALPLFRQLNDSQSEANVWQQLGDIYQNRQQWEAAAQAYLQAANFREKQGDLVGAILSWIQLAQINRALGNLQETERWYRKVIEGGKSAQDWISVSRGFRNLAELLYTQPQRLGEALKLAEASLSIEKSLTPNEAETWKTYTLMAKIAELQKNAAQAKTYRSLARKYKAEAHGTQDELQQHQQLIDAVVQTIANPKLKPQLETMLQQREGKGWAGLVIAIRRILKGERNWEKLCDKECLDLTDAMIVQKILQEI